MHLPQVHVKNIRDLKSLKEEEKINELLGKDLVTLQTFKSVLV